MQPSTLKLTRISIRNFRRLEDVTIDLEQDETVLVGPNNSGKTSATAVFRCFLGGTGFRIHDFSVSKVSDIDAFSETGNAADLPAIELTLWFSVDPNHISFGRAFTLLPNLSDELDSVGARLKYQARNPEEMLADYREANPAGEEGKRAQSLSRYLGTGTNLSKYFEVAYYSLDNRAKETAETRLDGKDGKSLLQGLVRVDFVDAQRGMGDEETSRSNRLSIAFATFYRRNLEQAEAEQSALDVINENNEKLTEHYEKHFSSLMEVIKGLGVPSINDRDLRIVSSLSPLVALQGSTDLLYVDAEHQHELPETYNGLGFKNLIYMAIQVSHYHLQWMRTEGNRPTCQLIFIEEPEVHLHAQVQQTFISNIRQIISEAAKSEKEPDTVPQFVISTHSSHILDTVDFEKVRYFQRCELAGDGAHKPVTLNASRVRSLRVFEPNPVEIDGKQVGSEEAKRFLLRYLKLTHCDLFFADAAILVEGTVEKLLLSKMIDKSAPLLRTKYLSILEVGGAYAHRFEGLLSFLSIPYLVITDVDSVDPAANRRACRGDRFGASTSNASLMRFFGIDRMTDLLSLSPEQKADEQKDRFVAFQSGIDVVEGQSSLPMVPRTIEEAFVYDNFSLFLDGKLDVDIDLPRELKDAYQVVFESVRSPNFNKTEFALNMLTTDVKWNTPGYIAEGLEWLEKRLGGVRQVQPTLDN